MIRCGESAGQVKPLACPSERETGEDPGDQAIRPRVAEEDQVAVGDILGRDLGVVLDREITTEEFRPLVREPGQPFLGPGLDGGAPGLAGPADTEEGAGEGVVDRALEAVAFAPLGVLDERLSRRGVERPPGFAVLREIGRARAGRLNGPERIIEFAEPDGRARGPDRSRARRHSRRDRPGRSPRRSGPRRRPRGNARRARPRSASRPDCI